MRAASEAQLNDLQPSAARAALGRLLTAIVATLLLLAIWRPTVVHAQSTHLPKPAPVSVASNSTDTLSKVHVVRAGETLWILAERYYGDGHKWEELARANLIATTANGKVLLVGMRLKVPGKLSAHATKVAATNDRDLPLVARTAAIASAPTLAAQTEGKGDDAPAPVRPARQGSATSMHVADVRTGPSRRGSAVKTSNAKAAPRVTGKIASSESATATTANGAPAARPDSLTTAKASAEFTFGDAASKPQTVMFASTIAAERSAAEKESPLVRPAIHIGLVTRESLRDARKANEASTVFIRVVPEQSELDAQAHELIIREPRRPRRGEYEAAPFSVSAALLAKAGRLSRRVGAPANASTSDFQRLTIADELELAPPTGVTLNVGDRLVSLHLTDEVTKGVRVAVPTGVVKVTRAERGKPVLAVVQTQAGSIEQGQPLLLVTGSAADPSVRATTLALNDVETTVRWIDGAESLPSVHSYVLFSVGASQGVHVGDEFDLHTVRPVVKGKPVPNSGEERIARARIVRTGDRESTAIIVSQERAEIAVGIPARRVARVP